jgi:MazG family protein
MNPPPRPAPEATVDTRLSALRELIVRLRAPDGCPWDRVQTLPDLRSYLLEEAHEVAAALDGKDRKALAEELGDLLFQIVFQACIGEEEGSFSLDQVIAGVTAKMIERHPHVFGDAERLKDAESVRRAWEKNKAAKAVDRSVLAGVPETLPALARAYRLTQKAAAVGFDWPETAGVLAKIREELAELEQAAAGVDRESLTEEAGDVLFAVANLIRHHKIDPEAALQQANRKFTRRFEQVEEVCRRQGLQVAQAGLETLDRIWDEIKLGEKRGAL